MEKRGFLSDRHKQYCDRWGEQVMDSLCRLILDLWSLSQGSGRAGLSVGQVLCMQNTLESRDQMVNGKEVYKPKTFTSSQEEQHPTRGQT